MKLECQALWHTLLITALGGQSQVDVCEFQDSLVSTVSSKTVSYTERACLKQTLAGPWKEQATPGCEE